MSEFTLIQKIAEQRLEELRGNINEAQDKLNDDELEDYEEEMLTLRRMLAYRLEQELDEFKEEHN